MTTPPEIAPFTAKELDEFELDCRRHYPAGTRMLRLCALARLGLESKRWKTAGELALAAEHDLAQELLETRRGQEEAWRQLNALLVGVLAVLDDDSLPAGALRATLRRVLAGKPIVGPQAPVTESTNKFADILKSPGFKKMAQEHTIREVFGDAMLANWLMNGDASPPGPPTPPDAHVLGEEDAIQLLRSMLDERATPEYEATIVRTNRVDVVVGGRTYLLRGAQAVTAYEVIRTTRPSRHDSGTLAFLVEMLAKRRLEIRLPDGVTPTDQSEAEGWQRQAEEGYIHPERTDGRYIKLSAAYWAEQWQPRITLRPVPLSLSECLAAVEVDLQEAMQTVAGLKAQLEDRRRAFCAVLELNADWHGSDWESLIGQVDRLQRAHAIRTTTRAELDAVADVLDEAGAGVSGSGMPAERVKTLLEAMVKLRGEVSEVERQLANERVDNVNIRSSREAIAAKLVAAEGVIEAGKRLIAKLKLDLEMARDDREQAEEDAEAASVMISRAERKTATPPSQKILTDAESRQRGAAVPDPKHNDLARRIRESEFIRSQVDAQGDDDWIAEATDGDLLDMIFGRLNAIDRLEDEIGSILGLVSMVSLGKARMIEGDPSKTTKQMVADAIERAGTEGRRESDVERAALVAKLALVREALGATLGPDGSDDVVDRARQLPQVADLTGLLEVDAWRKWMLWIAGELGIAGDPTDAAKTFGMIYDGMKEIGGAGWREAMAAVATLVGERLGATSGDTLQAVERRVRSLQDRVAILARTQVGSGGSTPGGTGMSAGPEDVIITAYDGGERDPGRFAQGLAAALESDRKIASGLASFGAKGYDLDEGPSASEQILRDVIAAALESGPLPTDLFEVRHRPASSDNPPRTELHVFAGKGPTTATTQVLAYVEIGQLYLIILKGEPQVGSSGYTRERTIMRDWRWPERIRAALDRK